MKNILAKKAAIALAALSMFGCATTISTVVQRPAELNMNGAKSISVLPFQISDDSKSETSVNILGLFSITVDNKEKNRELSEVATELTTKLSGSIASSGYYQFVTANAVQTKLTAGENAPCDAYLTGKFQNFRDSIESKTEKRKDDDDNEYFVDVYYRKCTATLVYEIIESKTNTIIAYKVRNIEVNSSNYDNKHQVPHTVDVLKGELSQITTEITHQIQPYSETVYLTFMKDKTKDPMMKNANTLAKNGDLKSSKDLFEKLYKEKGYMEAGYNQALLTQALGDLEGARDLLQEISRTTGNPKAIQAMNAVNREIESRDKLKAQNAQRENAE